MFYTSSIDLGAGLHLVDVLSFFISIPVCSALVQLHLESCVQFWVPQGEKDVKALENFRRRDMKMVKGLEEKPHEECLGHLVCSAWRTLREEFITV